MAMATILAKCSTNDRRKDSMLYNLFRSFGEIEYCEIFPDGLKNKNCGRSIYVAFKYTKSAEEAVQYFQYYRKKGSNIKKQILGAQFYYVGFEKDQKKFGPTTLLIENTTDCFEKKQKKHLLFHFGIATPLIVSSFYKLKYQRNSNVNNLKEQFEFFGNIMSLVVAKEYKNLQTQCYISFQSMNAAIAAAVVMNEKEINSKIISVKFVNINRTLIWCYFNELNDNFNGKTSKSKTKSKTTLSEIEIKCNNISSNNDQNKGNHKILNETEPFGAGKVCLKNLDSCIDEKFLRKEFSFFGIIDIIRILRDAEHNSIGIGFVRFKSIKDAVGAIITMHRRKFFSNEIYAQFANYKNPFRTAYINYLLCRLLNKTETLSRPHILYDKISDSECKKKTPNRKNTKKRKNKNVFNHKKVEKGLRISRKKKRIFYVKTSNQRLEKKIRKLEKFSKNEFKQLEFFSM